MKASLYLYASGCIFGVVGIGHLIRALLGISVAVGGWEAPMWLSWIGCPAALLLCVWAFALARRPM